MSKSLVQLENLPAALEQIMRSVGQMQVDLFRRHADLQVSAKDDGSYVCRADLESELMLKQALHALLPEAGFYAEESGKSGDGPYRWVIDPLDGTTNYVHGIPYFGISVALTYNDQPVCAAVFNPIAQDFFYAIEQGGAFMNGQRLSFTEHKQLKKTVVVICLPYRKLEGYACMLQSLPQIAQHTYAFRYLGAAALDQAYVASGGIDGICFTRLGWWDIAAGMLLIKEAGGIVSDFKGRQISVDYPSYVAGSQQVHMELLEILKNSSS